MNSSKKLLLLQSASPQPQEDRRPLLADTIWEFLEPPGTPERESLGLPTISELEKSYSTHLVHYIKEEGLRKLGEFRIHDAGILQQFGASGFVTLGTNDCKLDWEGAWAEKLHYPELRFNRQGGRSSSLRDREARQRLHAPRLLWGYLQDLVQSRQLQATLSSQQWQPDITLEAYVVAVKGAAAAGNEGLLHPLLQRWQLRVVSTDVFGLPALQAVAEFKWQTFARKLLYCSLACYLLWLGSFTVFMVLYHVEGSSKTLQELLSSWRGRASIAAELLSLVGMAPFMVVEVYTAITYKWGWLSGWNLVDVITYALQVTISTLHLLGLHQTSPWLSVAVALQCIFLSLRLQYFSRVFRSTNFDFMASLMVVGRDTWWYMAVMLLLMWGFACSFYTIFRDDSTVTSFDSLPLALLTMFNYAVGGASYYMTDLLASRHPHMAVALCIVYQLVVSMVLMALLAGVMANALAKVASNEQLHLMASRVQVIDELEAAMPKWLRKCRPGWFPQYVHVLRLSPHSMQRLDRSHLWMQGSEQHDSGQAAASPDTHWPAQTEAQDQAASRPQPPGAQDSTAADGSSSQEQRLAALEVRLTEATGSLARVEQLLQQLVSAQQQQQAPGAADTSSQPRMQQLVMAQQQQAPGAANTSSQPAMQQQAPPQQILQQAGRMPGQQLRHEIAQHQQQQAGKQQPHHDNAQQEAWSATQQPPGSQQLPLGAALAPQQRGGLQTLHGVAERLLRQRANQQQHQ